MLSPLFVSAILCSCFVATITPASSSELFSGICKEFNSRRYPEPKVFFYSSKKLFYFYEEKTWEDAQKSCENLGLELLSIHGKDENFVIGDFLTKLLYPSGSPRYTWTYTYVWLGGRREGNNWKWTSDNQTVRFTSWAGGEPDNWNGQEDCLQIKQVNVNGYAIWGDNYCKERKRFICESNNVGLE